MGGMINLFHVMFDCVNPQLAFQSERHGTPGMLALVDQIAVMGSQMFVEVVALRESSVASFKFAFIWFLLKIEN